MSSHTARDAEIAAAIDATLLRRRQQFDGQPAAWHVLCEAAHVATLGEPARRAFIARVAASRGADIALRLLFKAESIRATVTEALAAGEDVDAGQPAVPFVECTGCEDCGDREMPAAGQCAGQARSPAGGLLH
ncbi:hypothetical protein OR16_22673 [Cupriavidus basilensis OR16]|uniref:Uncharacterized protein n=1 Tax=Cupriavidus basilensis OR16 TaxID=1127483 RepID=H1S946_9BURK|nr:hypothetical protein [Cupriavidus basilensis]EHP40973.1 hypothetical protein OR16_22673 [Cupriavidus basilensis OR16]